MGKKLMLLFAVMLLFFAVMGYNVDLILSDQLSEISTVEMSAMVASVSSVDADNGYVISVKEPDGQLLIPAAIAQNMDVTEITALQPGVVISFRISISQIDHFRETRTGTIVALKTDHEILSVDDYNNIMHEEVRLAKVVGVGIQIILLILSIYLIYRNRTMLVTLLKRLFGR